MMLRGTSLGGRCGASVLSKCLLRRSRRPVSPLDFGWSVLSILSIYFVFDSVRSKVPNRRHRLKYPHTTRKTGTRKSIGVWYGRASVVRVLLGARRVFVNPCRSCACQRRFASVMNSSGHFYCSMWTGAPIASAGRKHGVREDKRQGTNGDKDARRLQQRSIARRCDS